MEIKQSTMTEMRLLSKQLIAFSEENTAANVSAEDMFIRTNFAVLEAAIEKETTANGTSILKHGVKNGLYYLLQHSATIVMAHHLGSGNDKKAAEVQKFIHYLDLNRDTIFADAVYAVNKSRQDRLRIPEQRAGGKEVRDVKAHTDRRIKVLSHQYRVTNRGSYIELQDAICSRLTFFNASRGGEPSRLRKKNW